MQNLLDSIKNYLNNTPRWYRTEVGKVQLVFFLITMVLTFIGEWSEGRVGDIGLTLAFCFGFCFWIFLPSFTVSILTKSKKIRLTSVTIMFVLTLLALYGQYLLPH